MAGATYSPRDRKDSKGRTKWYAELNFDGKRTMRYAGYTEEDANALGIRLCYEYNQNRAGVVNNSDVELDTAIAEFLDREGIKANTEELNKNTLDHFKLHNPKITKVRQLTIALILEWKRKLKEEFKYRDGTIQIRLRVLKAFIRFCALEKHYLVSNPIPKKFVPTYHSGGHYYTDDERRLLLSPIPSKDLQQVKADELLILSIKISQHQGLRLSQIWGIEIGHLKEATNRLWTKGLKGADDKEVICHPVTKACIKRAAQLNQVTSGRVFINWGSPDTMGQAFARKRDRLGIKEGRYHDNKHTCVSQLQAEGYNLDEISEITNTTKKALMFYTHADKAKLEDKFKDFGYGDKKAS